MLTNGPSSVVRRRRDVRRPLCVVFGEEVRGGIWGSFWEKTDLRLRLRYGAGLLRLGLQQAIFVVRAIGAEPEGVHVLIRAEIIPPGIVAIGLRTVSPVSTVFSSVTHITCSCVRNPVLFVY